MILKFSLPHLNEVRIGNMNVLCYGYVCFHIISYFVPPPSPHGGSIMVAKSYALLARA